MSSRPLALLLAFLLAGCAGGAPAADPTIAARASRNGVMDANARTFRMAIEQYATDNQGRYPDAARTLPQLTKAYGYLPGDRMPVEPFTGQPGPLVAFERGDLAALAIPEVGAAPPAWLGEADARRPGTVVYVVSPDATSYVLLGIGEAGGRPAVAHVSDNLPLPDARQGR